MESEEAMRVRVATKIVLPRVEEIRAHKLAHQPFRNCCRHCVRGRSDDIKRSRASIDMSYPVIAMEYAILGKGFHQSNPVFVGYDDKSESMMAWVVPSTGGMISVAGRVV